MPLAAEAEIETGAHYALGLFDIGESGPQPHYLRRERDLAGAEVEIIVFDKARHYVREGIFAADADSPCRPRFTRRIGCAENNRCRPIIVALPAAAALDVAEETLPGVADPAGDACERFDFAVIGNADLARAILAALGVRPGIVALDADEEAAGKLIVAAGLRAAEPAVRLVSAERLAEKGAARRAHNPVFLPRPQAARMAADIAVGPTPNRGERRRLIDRREYVGADGWIDERNQSGRRKQDFAHENVP